VPEQQLENPFFEARRTSRRPFFFRAGSIFADPYSSFEW